MTRQSIRIRGLHVLSSVCVLAVAGIALWSAMQDQPAQRPAVPASASSTAPDFTSDTARRYVFEYTNDSRVYLQPQGAPLIGQTRLTGTLVLQPMPAGMRLSIADVSDAAIGAGASVLVADAAAARQLLIGHAAVLEHDAAGRLARIGFPAQTPSAVQNVLQTLAGELQVTQRAGRSWQVEETTPHGTTLSHYVRSGDTVQRTRTGYQTLRATGRTTPKGAVHSMLTARYADGLHSLDHAESIDVNDPDQRQFSARIRLTLRHVGAAEPFPVQQAVVTRGIETIARSADATRHLLQQRIAGMTMEQLVDDVLRYANSGTLPDHHRWLWRATGVLKLHPQRCAELVPLFTETALNGKARGLLLDVLLGAGHGPAQAALRTMLDTPTARTAPDAGLYVQRLGLLTHPDPETVGYLLNRYTAADGAGRAESYALGASAGRALRQSGAPVAQNALTRLQQALDTADTPDDRAHLVTALGNAGSAQLMPVFQDAARAEAWQVREAAARALRAPQTADAESLVWQLTDDGNPRVRHSALQTLAGYTLASQHIEQLTAGVRDGTLAPSDYPALLALAGRHVKLGAPLGQMAREMLQRAPADPRLRQRIQSLVEALES